MEPISTVTTALSLAKSAGEISRKLFELGKEIKDRGVRQQVDEVLDKMRELKQSASELEDENRELRAKLRFNSDDFQFRNPFWYRANKPEEPLCPKCFAGKIAAPMGLQGLGCSEEFRRCLVCKEIIQVQAYRQSAFYSGPGQSEW